MDDEGNKMELSQDPMLESICPYVADIKPGETRSFHKELEPILSNEKIFGVNLYEAGLGTLAEDYFAELVTRAGRGAPHASQVCNGLRCINKPACYLTSNRQA
jgi:fructuronate reductase